MDKQYFSDIKTKHGAKKRYKSLCKKYHPDLPGNQNPENNGLMQEINRQYTQKLRELETKTSQKVDGTVKNVSAVSSQTSKKRKITIRNIMEEMDNDSKSEIVDAGVSLVKKIVNNTLDSISKIIKKNL